MDGVNTTTHERQITRLIIVASARITKMWRCHVKQAAFLHLFCFFYTPSRLVSKIRYDHVSVRLPSLQKEDELLPLSWRW